MTGSVQVDFFQFVLKVLEGAFRQIEKRVPPPKRVQWGTSFVFRYAEQTIQQAIVQKLARMISGLHAIHVLLERGLFQEQGMVQRAIEEINEDISFLTLAVIYNDVTERHNEFLRLFYAEEFSDPSDIVGSHTSRGMTKREKIQAYIHSKTVPDADLARAAKVSKVLTKAYSGFVHAASPHIMDMYGGYPAGFDIDGSNREYRSVAARRDAANYFFRAVIAMAYAAKAFADEALFASLHSTEKQLNEQMKATGQG